MTIAQRDGLALLPLLAWRYALGAALLFLFAGGARRGMLARAAVLPVLLLGTMQALVAGVSLSALAYIPAATLSFLFYTYPAWIAVIAAVRRTEPLTPTRLAALAIALVGIAVMVGAPSAGDIHPVGIGLTLVSALLYAVYVPVMEHFERRHGGPATATYVATGATLVFVASAIVVPSLAAGRVIPWTPTQWLAIGFLAVFSTAVGFITFLRGLAVIGPVRAAIVSTVEPFFTAVLAALLLGQRLTPATLAGGACVAAAVILLQRAHEAAKIAAARTIPIDPGVSDG